MVRSASSGMLSRACRHAARRLPVREPGCSPHSDSSTLGHKPPFIYQIPLRLNARFLVSSDGLILGASG